MGCTRTPMATPWKSGMPAAWRLCTARRVNMLLHTLSTARSSAALSFGSTPSTESWRPAPETPSRSSLFAEERTATRSVPSGSPASKSSRTFLGTLHFSTVARAASASFAMSAEPLSKASCSALTAASTPSPFTDVVMTPKGTACPFGALKPALSAMDSSFPEEAALEPAVCGESARSTTAMTSLASTFSCPSLAFLPSDFASVFAAPDAFAAASLSSASLAGSTRTSPTASTMSFTPAPSAALARRPS
mmetsp:Transcript_7301/g.20776  ORF Transcript_7301/g.20776 Transcript_7301/m.20776 type:complete len:249 (-) Transcript_7301:1510-2256(-)